jgi:hypothetical protein
MIARRNHVPMQSHNLSCLLGPSFGRWAAAVSIAGCLMGSNAFAAPTSIGLPGVIKHTAWVSEGKLSYVFDPAKKGQSPSVPFHIYSVPMLTH